MSCGVAAHRALDPKIPPRPGAAGLSLESPPTPAGNTHPGDEAMGKSQDAKKVGKKVAAKSLAEKRLEKKAKKEAKKY